MKKKLLALSIIPLLCACSIRIGDGFFEFIKEAIEDGIDEDFAFLQLYDGEMNRFSADLIYSVRDGLSLKIVEYDDEDIFIYPHGGEVSKSSNEITFTNDLYSSSELFQSGKYVLSHKKKDSDETFSLLAGDINYPLTTKKKDRPSFMNKSLVGKYYDEGEHYSLEVNRSSKKNGMTPSIILKEENKTYIGVDFTFSIDQVEFRIAGDEDGEYLKNGSAALTYDKEEDLYIFTIGDTDCTVLKVKEDESNKGFFRKSYFKVFNEHLSIELMNSLGTNKKQLEIKELDEGGETLMGIFDVLDNGETLKNAQELNGKLIFTKNNEYTLKHSVANNLDKVDLYKNGYLIYQDLEIEL